MSQARRITISIGCPSGIGPEVCLLGALRAADEGIRCTLVGDEGAVLRAALCYQIPSAKILVARLETPCLSTDHRVALVCPTDPLPPEDMVLGSPSAAAGRAQLAWIEEATRMAMRGDADAIVTGPVSKHTIARSGAPGAQAFAGHTEHIARLLGAAEPVMVFVTDAVAVALVTTHLRLADVPGAITAQRVATTTLRVAEIASQLRTGRVRVVVAALNPHAGENGLWGDEEQTVIVPGIERARKEIEAAHIEGIVDGPTGAETAFRLAFGGGYDAVVAMYHDQATIPMKVKSFGMAVNVTAGLPIVRTSVDHGTAYDIAGTGRANASSMVAAIRLADRLARARRE